MTNTDSSAPIEPTKETTATAGEISDIIAGIERHAAISLAKSKDKSLKWLERRDHETTSFTLTSTAAWVRERHGLSTKGESR